MIRFFLYSLSFLMIFSVPALAAETVVVRAGDHEGYVRLVFDWSSLVSYGVKEDADGTLSLSFGRAADLDAKGVEEKNGVGVPKQVSAAGENLRIGLSVPSGAKFRHFTVGNRIVLDIYTSAAANGNKPQVSQSHSPVKAAPVEPVKREGDPFKPAEKSAIEQVVPDVDAHVIAMSLTEAVGLAAFRRNGSIWIVLDKPDVRAAPEITGPQADRFSPFKRFELSGGVAFRADMPADTDMNIYGEGGGLIWRIVVSPARRPVKAVDPERVFSETETVRGGTVFWPLTGATKVIDLPDPDTGSILKVVTMQASGQFSGQPRRFVDFETAASGVGMAILPRTDDLQINLTGNGVQITRVGGLAMARLKDISRRMMRQEVAESVIEEPRDTEHHIRKIYDFDRWMMGGLQALDQNQRILMSGTAVKDKNGRVQDTITLAKMNIANDRGQEAIGLLSFAAAELPAVADGVEFKALQGAAYALAGKFELAAQELLSPDLQEYTELDYWRAFSFAWLEDWQQAYKAMPKDLSVLVGYPPALLEKIGLKSAEIFLRAGDVEPADKILSVLEKDRARLKSWTSASLDYLRGESQRQKGDSDSAKKIWESLIDGRDDLYRAKAGLALTMLQLQKGSIDREKAIDRLEGLRYAWRGDELEAQINFMLGKLYLEDRRYLKGFTILRDAVSMSPDSDIGREITAYMTERFQYFLMEDKEISPLDVVTIYEEFRELTPPGDSGNRLVQQMAERVVEADLLGRASDILKHQVEYRIQGAEKARVAMRLAAIQLLNKKPDEAIKSIDTAKEIYAQDASGDSKSKLHRLEIMRARALAQMDKTEEAIAMLSSFEPSHDVNLLRADIAWQSGLWEDAAEALDDLILDEVLDLSRPLTEKQAELVLNRAIALNLSGNRVALANMRKRYGDLMEKTSKSNLFDVVTRQRKSALLADRKTLETLVGEVDIFKDFLESFRSSEASN
ncbi:MAG: hypothetical protein HY370_07865 [Proteobacteria bacterium]|nr:hypothetical protein [Pseudomonadota bacterium]